MVKQETFDSLSQLDRIEYLQYKGITTKYHILGIIYLSLCVFISFMSFLTPLSLVSFIFYYIFFFIGIYYLALSIINEENIIKKYFKVVKR